MSRPATSKDVARLAGVAQSTVSYVLTGKGSISAETRDRVERAVKELGYRPNLAARSMRTRRTGRLAVAMGIPIYNPVEMLAGAGAEAEAAGYAMEVHNIEGSVEVRTNRVLELANSGQYEGIVSLAPVLPTISSDAPTDIPVLTYEDFNNEMHSAGELADASPVKTFVSRLAELGHQRFLHIAGPSAFASARARQTAYLEAIQTHGLESLGIAGGEWTGEAGADAIRALPEGAPPVAVIAGNDMIAVGVMRGAYERGWTVPGDVSVTGWDNYDVGAFLTPSLTTVDTDRGEAGRRAMRHLIAALRGEDAPRDLDRLNRIIWRESVAAPGATVTPPNSTQSQR